MEQSNQMSTCQANLRPNQPACLICKRREINRARIVLVAVKLVRRTRDDRVFAPGAEDARRIQLSHARALCLVCRVVAVSMQSSKSLPVNLLTNSSENV